MPHTRSTIRLAALLLVFGIGLLVAGCGSDSSTTSSSASTTSTTSTTGELQAKLQQDIDNATASCRDAASKISNTTLSNAATAACDQIDTDLTNQLATAIDQAKGDAKAAIENLAADCRSKASQLSPQGQDIVGNICDAIAATAQGQ